MTTTKIAPAARREAAIQMIVDDCVAGREHWGPVMIKRADLAASIRRLAPLGRTDRWAAAVEGWAVLIETLNYQGHAVDLRWSILQGSLFTLWESH